jgi:hypothetical protein
MACWTALSVCLFAQASCLAYGCAHRLGNGKNRRVWLLGFAPAVRKKVWIEDARTLGQTQRGSRASDPVKRKLSKCSWLSS